MVSVAQKLENTVQPVYVHVHVDTVESHQSPEKFMDVCNVKATGEDGSVSQHDGQSKEHPLFWIIMWPARFVFFQPLHRDTGAPLHVLCVCGSIVWPARLRFSLSFRHQRSLHFFFLRDVTVARATVTS